MEVSGHLQTLAAYCREETLVATEQGTKASLDMVVVKRKTLITAEN
jgi:hypothetical protein